MTVITNHKRILLTLGILGFLLLALIAIEEIASPNLKASASSSHNLSGYAWSDTIGWISFNCTNTSSCTTADYGVHINESTGVMSGYAWSSNVGWVSFNQSDLSLCPSAPCSATASEGALAGWAKALSANDAESGGWDGWISLRGADYGVEINGTSVEGYAWGSDVIGWVRFNGVFEGVTITPSSISASLSAAPEQVIAGGSSTLSWTSTNATSCSGTGFATGGATNGSVVVSPTVRTTYTLSCQNQFGSASNQAEVLVSNIECSDGADNDADGETDLDDLGCTAGSDNNEDSAALADISITASQAFVFPGGTVTISWSASNVTSCSVSSTNGDSWSGATGSQVSSAITESTTYTLSCTDVEEDALPAESVTVSLTPIFEEF